MPVTLDPLTVQLAEQLQQRHWGKYRGVVTDNQDPMGVGRLQVQVPAVLGSDALAWAEPCVPYAGDGIGLYAMPPVGTAVWVEFEAGNPDLPIWVGGWWPDNAVPTDNAGNPVTPAQKALRSEQGLQLTLDDSGHSAVLSDADGRNFLRISVNDGEIRVQSTTKVVVEAPQIELTDGAPHPLVFGDDLLTYLNQLVSMFNSHMHVGETCMGIPVTPVVPVVPYPSATPALLSTRVKTG